MFRAFLRQISGKGKTETGENHPGGCEGGAHFQDQELKSELASSQPYLSWINKNMVNLEEIEIGNVIPPGLGEHFNEYLTSFNYSREDIETIIKTMAESGKEPIGSMGNDVPPTVLSKKPYRLFYYFKQLFAQVTNPAIDSIREEMVMSLTGYLGSLQTNVLSDTPDHVKMVKFKSPVINNTYFQVVKNLRYKGFSNEVIPMHFNASMGASGLEKALDDICRKAERPLTRGTTTSF